MATTKQWSDWLKCNVLELIILILVLVLVVKAFVPVAGVSTEKIAVEAQEQLQTEEVPVPLEVPLTEGTTEGVGGTLVESVEQPLPETATELPVVN